MAYNQFGQWAGPHAGYFNEAGEPIMDAAAARFEAYLDEESARDAYDDDYYRDDAAEEAYYNEIIRCDRCGGRATRYEVESGSWSEVYDPSDDESESILCHTTCVPEGWEIA